MDTRYQVVMSQVMLPHQANVAGNVHGGEIMKFMDTAAGAAAMKYARCNCVTARVDELIFHLPIFCRCTGDLHGDHRLCRGIPLWTSMCAWIQRIWNLAMALKKPSAPTLPWSP